jgi:hypothetical protein
MKDIEKSLGIIDPERHCYRKVIKGQFANKDIVV